jgi:hypothetical protein
MTGTLTKSGKVEMNSGALIDLTFKTNQGYKLIQVYKNTDPIITWLDANKHYQFGPVSNPHSIIAIYEVVNPTGDFALTFPDGQATAVADVTGNYTGTTPNTHRPYNADVAMDEAGKLSGVGTVSGILNKEGGTQLEAEGGTVKTVNDVPTASGRGSFKGTIDGKESKASGGATGPLTLQSTGGSSVSAGGTGSGTATVGEDDYSSKSAPFSGDVTQHKANLTKAWDLDLKVRELTDARGKKYIVAWGFLRLPNGDRTEFLQKKVRYSILKGYSISFTSGLKLNPTTGVRLLDAKGKFIADRKSRVKITNMTFTGPTTSMTVNGGTLQYQFLGQKGTGNILDFLP